MLSLLYPCSLLPSLFLPLTGDMLSDFTTLVQDCINCSTTILNCYNNILFTAAGREKGIDDIVVVTCILYSVTPIPSFGNAMIFKNFF